MTDKELKKLNRYQLLEMLIMQTERADKLQRKLDEAEKQLSRNDIRMMMMGSIAEASLHINGVFEAAQDAADMYIEAAKTKAEEEAARIIREAREEAKDILMQAQFEVQSR